MSTKAVVNLDVVKPISRVPVSEQVAQQLLGLIQAGNLKAGQQLPPERELAVTLDVSRPSLREALRALSLLGVVKIRQGGGVYVSALDPESLLGPLHFFISLDESNFNDLFEARIIVEGAITKLAVSRITDEQIELLEESVADEDALLNDPQKFIDADILFHKTIFSAVDNSFLVRIATSLHVLGQASREVTGYIPGVLEESLKDHKEILKAMKARDENAACAAMESHLRSVHQAYRNDKNSK
ncbi:MAG: FadR family transcriptional regulator [Kordiimonadaceae bacterium]|nr:FadR family transcriptional regulator [Kordiimonadaceae bacterium]